MVRWPILLAALGAVLASSSRAQDVEGRIVEDSSGNRLPSAELKFRKAGMRELAADLETDGEGRFRASGLAAGDYAVEISKPNFITTTFKLRLPSTGLQLRLVRYGVISGQVVDSRGQPLPGKISIPGGRVSGSTRVAILVKENDSDEWRAVRQVMVGDAGKYRIFDLPPGQYVVGAWWGGVPAGSGARLYPSNAHPRTFTISGGEEYRDVDFAAEPGPSYSVSGKIEGPKPKMAFSVALGIADLSTLPVAQGWTEEDGTFQFDRIPPGTYDIFVAGPANGYGFLGTVLDKQPVFGRGRIQITGQNLEHVSVPVTQGQSVEIALRGPTGEPPPGCPPTAAASLSMVEPWWLMLSASVQAGFGKTAAIHDLPPSRYRVNLIGLGTGCYQVTSPLVDLRGGAAASVQVVVDRAGAIHGNLRSSSGQPKGFAVVLLDGEATAGVPAQLVLPDGDGRFVFEGLHPGKYRLSAQPAAEASKSRWVADVTRMIEVEVIAGKTTELDLPVAAPKPGVQ